MSWLILCGTASSVNAAEEGIDQPALRQSLTRAVAYLSAEVAKWKDEQKCYSCHHHGDGARALFAAHQAGFSGNAEALQVSQRWLCQPGEWDHNGPEGPFSDRKLARIQFAAALGQAVQSGMVKEARPLREAAARLAKDQLPNGAWDFVGADEIGEPATYGRVLATSLARRVLSVADRQQFNRSIAQSDHWLRAYEARSVLDAAAILIGLEAASDEAAIRQRKKCRGILSQGQGPGGGWGPYVTAGPECFDSAIAILGLTSDPAGSDRTSVVRGIRFLLQQQQEDGSWPETTRPTPRESYAERISTTAWCTLAFLQGLAL